MDRQDYPVLNPICPPAVVIVLESRKTVLHGVSHLALLRAGLERSNEAMARAQALIEDARQLLKPQGPNPLR